MSRVDYSVLALHSFVFGNRPLDQGVSIQIRQQVVRKGKNAVL